MVVGEFSTETTLLIVGGGPGGVLCATHLARLGATVEVFERLDPAGEGATDLPPNAWVIGLSPIAQRAMEAAGINPDMGTKWKYALSEICHSMHV